MTDAGSPGEMGRFFDDIEDLLRRVSDLGDEEISRLRSRVESSITQVRSAAGEGVDTAVSGARAAAEGAGNYVRGNPWAAVGIAVAAGILIGALLNRK